MNTSHTFTIVGGGIAGLTMAIALSRKGIIAPVIEAAPAFRPVGAGLSLAANAMQALQKLGVADDVIAAGRKLNAFSIYDHQHRLISRTNTHPEQSGYGISNFTIHRAVLHEVLLQHLTHHPMMLGKRLTDISIHPEHYTLHFDDGTQCLTQYLIAADGIHSPVRKKMLPQVNTRHAGYTCWRGLANNTGLGIEETSETWGPDGRFGITPLANDQVYWYACINAPEKDQRFSKFTTEDLARHFRHYPPVIGQLLQATPAHQLLWNDIVDMAPLPAFAFGNLVLTGDAAHATTPNMGQGACMAIEDAVVLANCLARESLPAHAFKAFEQHRIGRTTTIVQQSWQLGRMAQAAHPLLCKIRNAVFRMTPASVYQKRLRALYTVDFAD